MRKFLIIAIICVLVLSGCSEINNGTSPNTGEENEQGMREVNVVLYFANSQGTFVVPENRTILAEEDATIEEYVSLILEELIKGPKEQNLYPTIPDEVKVLNVDVEEDTVYIDFSEEMHTKHWGGATGEDMTISSLVNTLTELEGIKYVLPSVEGMALNIEHMIVDHPLERMEEKIYKE